MRARLQNLISIMAVAAVALSVSGCGVSEDTQFVTSSVSNIEIPAGGACDVFNEVQLAFITETVVANMTADFSRLEDVGFWNGVCEFEEYLSVAEGVSVGELIPLPTLTGRGGELRRVVHRR